ncbi:MAG: TetR/AcrR family transcriptional regulator [Armatimonadetes bacterium]|nr:TetR/AcrR family transcriptional regulator [Akkermansiaceae bacterium]
MDAAEEIMWKRSFHSVGLNEILNAVGVPKGSFYHYFESKEHFGVELLKHYINAATTSNTSVLLCSELESDPIRRITTLLESSIGKFQESGGKCPCLVLKLASEVTDLSDPMRVVLAEGMIAWLKILTSVLDEAKLKNLLPAELDASAEAGLIRDLWAGAIQRAAICKSTEPMRGALTFIKRRLALMEPKAYSDQLV